jgi:hypothetical protein
MYEYRTHRCNWEDADAWLNARAAEDFRLHSFEPVGNTSEVVIVMARQVDDGPLGVQQSPGMATTGRG